MTAKRINITLQEDILEELDATADEHGMNRSECIAFMVEVMRELNAWDKLQTFGAQEFAERFGRLPEASRVSTSMMLKAARRCRISM